MQPGGGGGKLGAIGVLRRLRGNRIRSRRQRNCCCGCYCCCCRTRWWARRPPPLRCPRTPRGACVLSWKKIGRNYRCRRFHVGWIGTHEGSEYELRGPALGLIWAPLLSYTLLSPLRAILVHAVNNPILVPKAHTWTENKPHAPLSGKGRALREVFPSGLRASCQLSLSRSSSVGNNAQRGTAAK